MPTQRLRPTSFIVATAIVMLLDQLSKWIITAADLQDSITLVAGFFEILYRENHGGAWGLLRNQPEWFRMPFFVGTSLLAIVFLLWMRGRMEVHRRWVDLAFPAILGGAAGNLIDRVRLGYVVDFLDFDLGFMHWPTFNVADIGITVGVILLVADSLFAARSTVPGSGPAPSPTPPAPPPPNPADPPTPTEPPDGPTTTTTTTTTTKE
jgi:signal peptidase II